MNWIIFLFAISVCGEVSLTENTDPFSNITTVQGVAPNIDIDPVEREVTPTGGLKVKPTYPDFSLSIHREDNDVFIKFRQVERFKSSFSSENISKPILGANSKLSILFENGDVLIIRYRGDRIEATDSNDRERNAFAPGNSNRDQRLVSIGEEFKLDNSDIQKLKSNKVKQLRVEFENSTTDREFNSNNENYFVKYLPCLEI